MHFGPPKGQDSLYLAQCCCSLNTPNEMEECKGWPSDPRSLRSSPEPDSLCSSTPLVVAVVTATAGAASPSHQPGVSHSSPSLLWPFLKASAASSLHYCPHRASPSTTACYPLTLPVSVSGYCSGVSNLSRRFPCIIYKNLSFPPSEPPVTGLPLCQPRLLPDGYSALGVGYTFWLLTICCVCGSSRGSLTSRQD